MSLLILLLISTVFSQKAGKTEPVEDDTTANLVGDVVRAYFAAWMSYNHIFFHHLLMDNFVDDIFHTAIGMSHDVIPSNNVCRGAEWRNIQHVQTGILFCGGPVPFLVLTLFFLGFVNLPSWYFLSLVTCSYTSILCHFTHRAMHQLNFNPDNYAKGGLKFHERLVFYPIHCLCQIGLLNCYDGHYGHHYNEDGQTDSMVAIAGKKERSGFAMFACKNPILAWTLSLDYVDRDAYTFAFMGNYVISAWSAVNFALRLYAILFDRMLTVALIQWSILIFAKLMKPSFDNITITDNVKHNYTILAKEKKMLFSGDHTNLKEQSDTVGLNPRKYDARLKKNLKMVIRGEKEEWKRQDYDDIKKEMAQLSKKKA